MPWLVMRPYWHRVQARVSVFVRTCSGTYYGTSGILTERIGMGVKDGRRNWLYENEARLRLQFVVDFGFRQDPLPEFCRPLDDGA